MSYPVILNGTLHDLDVPAHWTVQRALREKLGLMSVREACGIGMCGSCTVLVDGQVMTGCLLLVPQVAGKRLETTEGLAPASGDGPLHPVQQAFLDHHAFQCSFCTPGFLLAVTALLRANPRPTDDEIREFLAGNLCRCGAYPEILAAVRALAGRADQPDPAAP